MRHPTLQQSFRVIRKIAPLSVTKIIDIGAQRKTEFLMDVYPDVIHHLFEPVSTYYDELKHNYNSRGIPFVLHNVALGDTDGMLYLHNQSVDGSGRITHSRLLTERQDNFSFLVNIEEVTSRRLDSIMNREELGDLSYLVKLDVDGLEEKIIEGGLDVIGGASFVVIEASIGRQDLCSRAALLEKCGFRMFDICDNAYFFGQLALVDLVMINKRLRQNEIKFRPWEYTGGKVVWKKWQHGFPSLANELVEDPYSD